MSDMADYFEEQDEERLNDPDGFKAAKENSERLAPTPKPLPDDLEKRFDKILRGSFGKEVDYTPALHEVIETATNLIKDSYSKGKVDANRWWITTDFFANGGKKVMGAFESRELALNIRNLLEDANSPRTYAVDEAPPPLKEQ